MQTDLRGGRTAYAPVEAQEPPPTVIHTLRSPPATARTSNPALRRKCSRLAPLDGSGVEDASHNARTLRDGTRARSSGQSADQYRPEKSRVPRSRTVTDARGLMWTRHQIVVTKKGLMEPQPGRLRKARTTPDGSNGSSDPTPGSEHWLNLNVHSNPSPPPRRLEARRRSRRRGSPRRRMARGASPCRRESERRSLARVARRSLPVSPRAR